MSKINILIVDDEALLRQGVSAMLSKEDFVRTVYEAEDEQGFISNLSSHHIDIILLDIRLRTTSGINLLKKMESLHQQPKVIAVTGLDGVEVIVNLLRMGINAIVYKLDGYGEIIKAIQNILQSGSYFPETILKIIQSNAKRWEDIPPVLLTAQEKDLLKGIANGSTTKQIAIDLKMSPATAETYRIRLMKKVGVPNTAALLAYAFRNGIL